MRSSTLVNMNLSVAHKVPAAEAEGQPSGASLPSLSPSRAADFMSCPLLYRFRTIDRLPEPPSPEATRGTVVHGVLEQLFELPAEGRTPDVATQMVRPEWHRLLADEPELASLFDGDDGTALEQWLASAEALVQRYFTLEDPQRLEPAEREHYVETTLDSGLRLRGYIDRLDRAPATGELRVVDYKTGKAPRAGFEQRVMFQMRFYALVLWRLHGIVPRLLQLIYLGSGEILRYEPDEADLLATERKLGALWAAIERATERKDWRPSPSKLCDWCAHQALCPAYGGTPPPVPDAPVVDDAGTEAPSPRTPGADV